MDFKEFAKSLSDFVAEKELLEAKYKNSSENVITYRNLYNTYKDMYDNLYNYTLELITQDFVNKEKFYKWHNERHPDVIPSSEKVTPEEIVTHQ